MNFDPLAAFEEHFYSLCGKNYRKEYEEKGTVSRGNINRKKRVKCLRCTKMIQNSSTGRRICPDCHQKIREISKIAQEIPIGH